MTMADALNILAHPERYTAFNLGTPSFFDLDSGGVGVSFKPARSDGQAWGEYSFSDLATLQHYTAGYAAAKAEAAFDEAQAQTAPAATLATVTAE